MGEILIGIYNHVMQRVLVDITFCEMRHDLSRYFCIGFSLQILPI